LEFKLVLSNGATTFSKTTLVRMTLGGMALDTTVFIFIFIQQNNEINFLCIQKCC